MTEKPRWWLILVAAAMAAIFLYQSIGRNATLLLLAGYAIGYGAYRFRQSRRSPARAANRCLTCGDTLPASARECRHCGSARWTVIN